MAGYAGYRMSNNAVQAYSDGEKPYSKWSKADIIGVLRDEGVPETQIAFVKRIPLKELKALGLRKTSWHHTSSHYNATDFYTVDIDRLSTIDYIPQSEPKAEPKAEEKWYAEYLIWSGTRKYPKATTMQSMGVVRGNWFYLPDGTRKSINSRGFRLIRRL